MNGLEMPNKIDTLLEKIFSGPEPPNLHPSTPFPEKFGKFGNFIFYEPAPGGTDLRNIFGFSVLPTVLKISGRTRTPLLH